LFVTIPRPTFSAQLGAVGSKLYLKAKEAFPVGTAGMRALLAASVKLNPSPIACPDNVKEPIHGEFMIVAVPVSSNLASCATVIKIVGAIGNGLKLS
jgi:hypothetical protein